MANGNGLRKILKDLQWSAGGPSRSDYEAYLREHRVLDEHETLANRPDISEAVYRDWLRRPQVACVFARRIATQPGKFNVTTVVVPEDPAEEMTRVIDSTAEAAVAARGSSEALTVLLPKLINPPLLAAFCKRLGARNGNWRIGAMPNPSDRLNRVHVSLRFTLRKDVEAEILGMGPFTFLPATRRAPITALEFRTKVEGHKKRGRAQAARSHLADIPWPSGTDAWFDKAWQQSQEARRDILGGDDSAARARINVCRPPRHLGRPRQHLIGRMEQLQKRLVKNRHVLVVGHADADGHLAVEQSRRNVLKMGALGCGVFIDRKQTSGHRMWRNYISEIPSAGADLVIFVDIMFRPDDPLDSVQALIELAGNNPEKTFVVIDHHPVLGLPALPLNLGVWFTSAVYTCCFGPPSWLMVVAAICDRDEGPVAPMIDETMRHRALAMARAVADPELAGANLLRLLAGDRWDLIEPLAAESSNVHRRVRGRRVRQQPLSMGLVQARAAAAG